MKNKQLVLIGGGHAHMITLANLNAFTSAGYRVVVIQPSDYHYYSGMGPGMLGGTYKPEQIRFHTREVVESQGGIFIRDKARSIDPVEQLVNLEKEDKTIPYDVLSCNAGSYVPGSERDNGHYVFPAKPIERFIQAGQVLLEKSQQQILAVAVIGGGPSSVEIAGNIWQLTRNSPYPPEISIFAGKTLMNHHPQRLRNSIRKVLSKRDIHFVEGSYVDTMEQGEILLKNGRRYPADLLFPAIGVNPSPIFARSQLPTGPDGGLLVNTYLQSTDFANIFGGGDCIAFQPQPLDKVGVYAVRQNPVLFHNLKAALAGKKLQRFDPGGSYLRIYNLGGGQGVLQKNSFILSGRIAFLLKDYIDQKFIRSFSK